MIIYNVTINIDEDVHDEWLQWMNEVHIPDVMSCGLFTNARMCRLLEVEEEGSTYAVQYSADTMKDFEQYRDVFAPALQASTRQKFGDKFVAFRTVLEVVYEHRRT